MGDERQPQREDPLAGRRALAERLAEKFGGAGNVKVAFGDPVERGETTVIPVAKVRLGFGAGQGGDETSRGSGGGGGLQVTPVGYIEMTNGSASYRPIRDLAAIVPVIVASGFASLLLLTGVSRLIPSRSRGRNRAADEHGDDRGVKSPAA